MRQRLAKPFSKLLITKGISVNEFCKKIGTTAPTYYHWLDHPHKIPTDKLIKMSRVLGVSSFELTQIFSGAEIQIA